MPSSRAFGSGAVSAADASTYTFTGMSFGTAASDRYIVVGIAWRSSGTTNDVTSVTIGGVSATLVQKSRNISTNMSCAHLYIAAVPTGTSGTVVVNTSSTAVRMGVATWALYGIDPASTANGTATGNATSDVSITLPSASHVLGVVMQSNGASRIAAASAELSSGSYTVTLSHSSTNTTWGTLTENYDAQMEATSGNQAAAVVASWAQVTGGGTDALTATGVASGTPSVGSPAVGQKHTLTATGVATATPSVGSPAITQTHALTATGVATSAPSVGSPSLGQVHALTASGVSSGTPSVGSPALSRIIALTATGVSASPPSVGSPAIAQVHTLSANDVASGVPSVGSPVLTIGGTVNLVASDLTVLPFAVGSPALSQVIALIANGITCSSFVLGRPFTTDLQPVAVSAATLQSVNVSDGVLIASDPSPPASISPPPSPWPSTLAA